MGRRVGTLIILVLVVLFAYGGYRYFSFRSANAVSEAAFIKSDRLANLTFKVDGKVTEMLKKENEPVKEGELLAVIDPTDLKVAKEELLHIIESLVKSTDAMELKKRRLKESLALETSIAGSDNESVTMKLKSLGFRIKAAETKLEKLDKDTLRYEKMLRKRLIASSDFESVRTERDSLSDEIEGMRREYDALKAAEKASRERYRLAMVQQRTIEELQKGIEAKREELKSRREALSDIENKIGYTRLYAPFDGVIAKRYFEAPLVVEKGTPVYALIDPSALYCEVLLSEKKMRGVKPGNPVTITVDALEGREISGKVESIAPVSASTFSLVPRDIASGEFTKLDQRFKIRISIEETEGLRSGMSASVAIERR
ncbi:secretion protein HlyD family protein [Hydrogenimonas sp.]|nr:secretion protein HlyD family protein [Hydrogenimonas sp.]